jgi:hypothetical protein
LQLRRTFWSIVHDRAQKTTCVLNAKYLAEEKERKRYELRERNSDLRLQVYELEKRSQLLGQSLQVRPVACVKDELQSSLSFGMSLSWPDYKLQIFVLLFYPRKTCKISAFSLSFSFFFFFFFLSNLHGAF